MPYLSVRDEIFRTGVLLAAEGAVVVRGLDERVARALVAHRPVRATRHHDGVTDKLLAVTALEQKNKKIKYEYSGRH